MNVFVGSLSSQEVNHLLTSLDKDFAEHLSSYIDLSSYSMKLATYATFILVQIDKVIVGVLAYYTNEQNKELYIPYLCVSSDHRRMGIADELLRFLCKYADSYLFSVKLEVRNDNNAAVLLYQKYGFVVVESSDIKSKMLRKAII